MTNGPETKSHYPLSWLPWILGGGVFALYLLTVNHHLSFLSDWAALQQLPAAVRALNWSYNTEFLAPVYFAATLPLRWLPPQFIPLAFNLFSAGCAALVFAQLARSVALLPHDRTVSQRDRLQNRNGLITARMAWLPPLFAVVVGALTLSVWEHGTNGTGEMFDLLLFAYVVRSFLEYRLDEQDRRLYRAALVYGLGITNNPAMIAFLPMYIGALVWTRKLQFFNLRFLGKMALFGGLGLLGYLILPLAASFKPDQASTFWELLQSNFYTQRWVLTSFPRNNLLLLSLTSILPVFLLAIRWSSQFGDPSHIGAAITTATYHLCHAVILLACLWMVLDPGFSPREIAATLPFPSNGFNFLPLYYFAALSIGYYSGYLLLVSRAYATRTSKPGPYAPLVERGVAGLVILLLLAMPAILWHRNAPQIRLTNGPLENQFAADLAAGIPEKGLILSDEPRRLWVLQEYLTKNHRAKDYIFICTSWLQLPQYQKHLARKSPQWSPAPIANERMLIAPEVLLQNMEKNGKAQPVAYLHPSFGYYFESFRSEPAGLGSRLTLDASGELLPPPLSAEIVEQNTEFWEIARGGVIATLLPAVAPIDEHIKQPFPENFYRSIGLKPQPNQHATLLANFYSRSLVKWGVELQSLDKYEAAADAFKLAQQLNPKNVVAEINLTFNQKFQTGEPMGLEVDKKLDDIFGETRSWEQVLTFYGPYDTPGLAFAQGQMFSQGGLVRQAARYFDRARRHATNDISSRLWLGYLNLNRNQPDRTLEMIREIRSIGTRVPEVRTNLSDLFTLEAAAYLAKKDDATANEIITTNLAKDPKNFNLLAAACKAYADNSRYAKALELTDRMLKLEPDNVACLINRGCFLMEKPDFEQAIQSFSRVLTLETNNYRAVLYRAIAQLRAGQYDEAVKDYETVQRQYPKEYSVDFGLGEIAYRRRDTNSAIRYFESYLKNAPPGTGEAKAVTERLNEMKGVPVPSAPPPISTNK